MVIFNSYVKLPEGINGVGIQQDFVMGFHQWPCNRNRFIGGTGSIYFWPIFQGYCSGNIPTIHMALYGTVPPF